MPYILHKKNVYVTVGALTLNSKNMIQTKQENFVCAMHIVHALQKEMHKHLK